MLKKIKDILGIEGVKVELKCREEISRDEEMIRGEVILTSKSEKVIESLTIKLLEKYQRGRNESVLINEYLLSSLDLETNLTIGENKSEKLKFKLPVSRLLSEVDQFEQKNIFALGLAAIAKKIKNVKSYYRIEVEVKVKGTSLNPIAKTPIKFI